MNINYGWVFTVRRLCKTFWLQMCTPWLVLSAWHVDFGHVTVVIAAVTQTRRPGLVVHRIQRYWYITMSDTESEEEHSKLGVKQCILYNSCCFLKKKVLCKTKYKISCPVHSIIKVIGIRITSWQKHFIQWKDGFFMPVKDICGIIYECCVGNKN